MGDLAFARRVAAQHVRELRAALEPQTGEDDLDSLEAAFAADDPDGAVTTGGEAGEGAAVPRFTIAIAGELEGKLVIGLSVYAATDEDEQRLWRYLLDHPDVGEPLQGLLANVSSWETLERDP